MVDHSNNNLMVLGADMTGPGACLSELPVFKFRYEAMVSPLPPNRTIEMVGLHLEAKPDPSPSVLVLNIGALKEPNCPEDHRVYMPTGKAAFHRMGFYSNVDVMDPTWTKVAHTWSWADSQWKQQAIASLEAHDIYPVGRYARWVFQGIADSVRDGLMAGATVTSLQWRSAEEVHPRQKRSQGTV